MSFGTYKPNRPSISGHVQIQVQTAWVRRYASVSGPDATFSLKDNEEDPGYKLTIDLRTAKIKKGVKNGAHPYIYIERDGKVESRNANRDYVRMGFQDSETMTKWMRAIMVATLTDEELIKSTKQKW